MTYTVKYKLPGSWFWSTLKNAKADFVAPDMPYKIIVLDDETRIELPFGTVIKYNSGRFMIVKQNMENESGQQIVTKK